MQTALAARPDRLLERLSVQLGLPPRKRERLQSRAHAFVHVRLCPRAHARIRSLL